MWLTVNDEEIIPDLRYNTVSNSTCSLYSERYQNYKDIYGGGVNKTRCFEFYTLYVGVLSSQMVNNYNATLLRTLKTDHPHWFN
jgi:hypothetical protein